MVCIVSNMCRTESSLCLNRGGDGSINLIWTRVKDKKVLITLLLLLACALFCAEEV